VLFDGADATARDVQSRNVGFVFQHYALFRHMTVFENVGFGLRVRPHEARPGEAEIRRRVHTLLDRVQLDTLGHRYPHQLSGGQRQRVALARALAIEPKVLLLDEPFGALDAKVRRDLRRWLRRLHDEIQLTSVLVTHDQEEALEVADRVAVFNHGRIEQVGTPREVYEHPATAFVYQFLGHANRFESRVQRGVAEVAGLRVPVPEHADASPRPAHAFTRPHDVDVRREPLPGAIAATVTHLVSFGASVRLELTAEQDQSLDVELSREVFRALAIEVGTRVYARPRSVRVFVHEDQRLAA
jgi:sulfate transport system ATP-binding protein